MPATIRVVNMYTSTQDVEGLVVNTTSKAAGSWERDLSPFHLGPCDLYGGHQAVRMENAWQFSKLYDIFINEKDEVTKDYWDWAKHGWADLAPHRYPMGRGAKPRCSLWDGQRYGYIEARKRIYAPLYAEAVQKTKGWQLLRTYYEQYKLIVLRDYDGYDYAAQGKTLTQVLNDPARKMGHAFVLAMLLTNDSALDQLFLRR